MIKNYKTKRVFDLYVKPRWYPNHLVLDFNGLIAKPSIGFSGVFTADVHNCGEARNSPTQRLTSPTAGLSQRGRDHVP